MNSKVFTAVILGFMMFSAIPYVFADGSEAYTATDGERGVGFSFNNLPDADFTKLYGDTKKTSMATEVLDRIVKSTSAYKIEDIAVTGMSESSYLGQKVAGTTVTTIEANSQTYKISFKATVITGSVDLFENTEYNVNAIKELGMVNKTQTDAYFTVNAEVKSASYEKMANEYTANSSGNFVLTKSIGTEMEDITSKVDATYTYIAGGSEKTLKLTYDYGQYTYAKSTLNINFNGKDVKDLTASDYCEQKRTIDDLSGRMWSKATANSHSSKIDVSAGKEMYEMMYLVDSPEKPICPVTIETEDLVAEEYQYYGSSGALFTPSKVSDAELKDNGAMKAFLQKVGTVTDTYSGVESGSDSLCKAPSKGSNLLLYGGIGAAVAIVAVLGILIFLKKRAA